MGAEGGERGGSEIQVRLCENAGRSGLVLGGGRSAKCRILKMGVSVRMHLLGDGGAGVGVWVLIVRMVSPSMGGPWSVKC